MVAFERALVSFYRPSIVTFPLSLRVSELLPLLFRDGKEPSLLEFGSVRVLPNIRVRSVRVLSSYGKMKVRFWFGSLCTVSGSVRFGSMRFLIHICFSLGPTCLQFT